MGPEGFQGLPPLPSRPATVKSMPGGHTDVAVVGSLPEAAGPQSPVTKPDTYPPITKQSPGGHY